MRYLGIDYGSKRVGIALSDEGGTMGFPEVVLLNSPKLVKDIVDLIERHNVDEVVIGYSLNTRGEENPIQEAIDELVLALTLETGVPVRLETEQYTTKEALRIQGRTEKTDASAAALILNSYLYRTKNKNASQD